MSAALVGRGISSAPYRHLGEGLGLAWWLACFGCPSDELPRCLSTASDPTHQLDHSRLIVLAARPKSLEENWWRRRVPGRSVYGTHSCPRGLKAALMRCGVYISPRRRSLWCLD
eukprot:COSAG01_NODE_2660_length_7299_cov_5.937639_3_plen_114_part_00